MAVTLPDQTTLPAQSVNNQRAVWLLVGLSLIFAIVPDTLSFNSSGLEADHTITQGSMWRQIEYIAIFMGAAVYAWRYWHASWLRLKQINPFLVIVYLYCLISALWSGYPDITIKRVIICVGLILTGLAVAPPFSTPRQFLRVVMGVFTGILVVSAVVAILVPEIGVDNTLGNAWRGITWQKNMLGSIAGFTALLWLREWMMTPATRRASSVGLLFSLFVLVMAKSATAILVTFIGMSIYMFTRRRLLGGRHSGQIVALGFLLVVLYAVLVFFVFKGHLPTKADVLDPITSLFNKSSDFTGRGQIWELVDITINKHPLWGVGYAGFWVGQGGPSQYIANRLGWMPGQAHNGYIDILLDMGEVGMGLFALCILWHVISILRLFRVDREDAAMHLALIVAILISNLSETQILRDTNFQNILFIYSSLAISGRLAMSGVQRRRDREAARRQAELSLASSVLGSRA